MRELTRLAGKGSQTVRITPDDRLYRSESRVNVEVSDVAGRALVLFNIAGDGTLQALYPIGSDAPVIKDSTYRFQVRVRGPFGADQLIAITSAQRMTALEQAVNDLDKRRTALQALGVIERLLPPDARIGTTGLFTAP